MGSGGLRGLQNRCFGAEASKGWFDSDTPPPSSCCVEVGGAERDRTVDLLNAIQALSQLSYGPTDGWQRR